MFKKLKKMAENLDKTVDTLGKAAARLEGKVVEVLEDERTKKLMDAVIDTADKLAESMEKERQKQRSAANNNTPQNDEKPKPAETTDIDPLLRVVEEMMGAVSDITATDTAEQKKITDQNVNSIIRSLNIESSFGGYGQAEQTRKDILDAVTAGDVDAECVNLKPVLNSLNIEYTMGNAEEADKTANWVLDMIDAGVHAERLSVRSIMMSLSTEYSFGAGSTSDKMEDFILHMIEKGARTEDLTPGLRSLESSINIQKSFHGQHSAEKMEQFYRAVTRCIEVQGMSPEEKAKQSAANVKAATLAAFAPKKKTLHAWQEAKHGATARQIRDRNQFVASRQKRRTKQYRNTGHHRR